MATKVIDWNEGTGNITLTYGGHGNGSITASSDANDAIVSRSQEVEVKTIAGGGTVKKSFTINQKVSPLTIKTVGCSNSGLLKADGTVDESSSIVSQGYKYSDYLEIPEGVNGIYYQNIFPNTGANSGVCVYDSNKVFLIRGEYNNTGRRYSMGILNFSNYSNAKYIRFSKSLDNVTYYLRWLNIISDIRYSGSEASLGGLLKADGTVNTDSNIVSQGYKYSDYISIPAGSTHLEARVFPVGATWSGLQIFNNNKTFLGNGTGLGNGGNAVGQGVTQLSNFTNPGYIRFSPKLGTDNYAHVRLLNMVIY